MLSIDESLSSKYDDQIRITKTRTASWQAFISRQYGLYCD